MTLVYEMHAKAICPRLPKDMLILLWREKKKLCNQIQIAKPISNSYMHSQAN